jgi:hypothetical protein
MQASKSYPFAIYPKAVMQPKLGRLTHHQPQLPNNLQQSTDYNIQAKQTHICGSFVLYGLFIG